MDFLYGSVGLIALGLLAYLVVALWQGYSGETTMSYLTQMLGLTVQNFVFAATGMAVLIAFIRGIARRGADTIGNFWVDLTRGTFYILLPFAIVVGLILVSQGTVQNLMAYQPAQLIQPLPMAMVTVSPSNYWRWGQPLHNSPSSIWGPMAVAFSMPILPIPLKARPPLRTL